MYIFGYELFFFERASDASVELSNRTISTNWKQNRGFVRYLR